MRGTVTGFDGQETALPELVSWRLLRTAGDGCDGFEVVFPMEKGLEAILARAVGFSAFDESRQVFCGIVDDYEISLSGKGLLVSLSGRGMGGRLLDNEMPAAEYSTAYLPQILERYVHAFGVKSSAVDLPSVPLFSVPLGTNCLAVVQGFCRHAGALPPWFSSEGTLQIAKTRTSCGKTFLQEQVISAAYCNCRYGVISRQMQITAKGVVTSAVNSAFTALGGSAQKVCARTGTTLPCNYRTPQQQIEESCREEFALRMVLPGNFLAEPAQTVEVRLPALEVTGEFWVQQCQSEGGADGITCTLSLLRA